METEEVPWLCRPAIRSGSHGTATLATVSGGASPELRSWQCYTESGRGAPAPAARRPPHCRFERLGEAVCPVAAGPGPLTLGAEGPRELDGSLAGVFERFTDRARTVLVLAQEEARLLNHSFIGTEHILLGLIHEGDGVAAKALRTFGISLEAVREKVEETIVVSGAAPMAPPPFTPRAKKVLELSLREALQLGHHSIGTEHLLLGLVREGEGVAATLLISLGADLGRVRQEVVKLMSGETSGDPVNEVHNIVRPLRSPATSEPSCPQCRASVAHAARIRAISVVPDAEDADPMSIDVVYCTHCGTTLHMFKAEGTS
jgi:hypothetical protein